MLNTLFSFSFLLSCLSLSAAVICWGRYCCSCWDGEKGVTLRDFFGLVVESRELFFVFFVALGCCCFVLVVSGVLGLWKGLDFFAPLWKKGGCFLVFLSCWWRVEWLWFGVLEMLEVAVGFWKISGIHCHFASNDPSFGQVQSCRQYIVASSPSKHLDLVREAKLPQGSPNSFTCTPIGVFNPSTTFQSFPCYLICWLYSEHPIFVVKPKYGVRLVPSA